MRSLLLALLGAVTAHAATHFPPVAGIPWGSDPTALTAMAHWGAVPAGGASNADRHYFKGGRYNNLAVGGWVFCYDRNRLYKVVLTLDSRYARGTHTGYRELAELFIQVSTQLRGRYGPTLVQAHSLTLDALANLPTGTSSYEEAIRQFESRLQPQERWELGHDGHIDLVMLSGGFGVALQYVHTRGLTAGHATDY